MKIYQLLHWACMTAAITITSVAITGCATPGSSTSATSSPKSHPQAPQSANATPTIQDLSNRSNLTQAIESKSPAKSLMPTSPIHGVMRRTADDGTTQNQPFTLKPDGDGWMLTIQNLKRVRYALNEDNDLTVPWEDDYTENAHVVYDPAVVIWPAVLSQNAHKHGQSKMTVKNLDTGKKRDTGKVTYDVNILGHANVKTPAGNFGSTIVHMTRHIDLSLANVKTESWTAGAPGCGEVADATVRNIKALAVFGHKTRYRLERAQ